MGKFLGSTLNDLFSDDIFLFLIFRTSTTIEVKAEPSDEINCKNEITETSDDNLPLDLSCSKSKRSCQDDYWTSQHTQAVYPLTNNIDQFQELNDLATTAMFLNNIKQEQITKNMFDFQNLISNQYLTTSIKQESSTANFKQIEQSIRDTFQYPQPLRIPEGKYFSIIFCID
jgi:hypothetical protein